MVQDTNGKAGNIRPMKPLLSKTTRPFLIYVLAILLLSVPVYYFVIERIWISELDEHNRILARNTETEFNRIQLSPDELTDKIKFWNAVQPGLHLEAAPGNIIITDTVFTAKKNSPYVPKEADDNFRVLITSFPIQGKPYYLRATTSFEDTREVILVIALITFFFFVCILTGLLVINRKLSKTVWMPFRNTLEKLKLFNLNSQSKVVFDTTDTKEFEELNESLSRLIDHTVSTYSNQKEFTENASHELQTPLAILKNKLDIMLQTDDLTERQYIIAEEMNKALVRSASINRNLLLLARIDNNQYDSSGQFSFDAMLLQSLELLQEYFDQKNINITTNIDTGVIVRGNSSLTDVLINNLLLNTIRHTPAARNISVTLTKSVFETANPGEQALDADLLFRRFSKFSTDNSGSGLGLSIVQEICRLHHWTVQYRFENAHHIFSVRF